MDAAIDQVRLSFDPGSLVTLNVVLGVMLFGVALDIRVADFRRISRDPRGPVVGLAAQFLLLPALTFELTLLLDPPPSVALGMLLVAACPGGNISNFLTFMARGNAALSVVMTAVSTAAAVVMTPLNFTFWAGLRPETSALLTEVALDPADLLGTVAVLLGVPLLLGMFVGSRFPKVKRAVMRPLRVLGGLVFVALVLVMLARNREAFVPGIGWTLASIVLHNAMALAVGYGAARLFRCPPRDARAIAIEVGIQNSALALVLIFSFFGGLGGMAVVAAGWGVWHIVSGLSVATFWSMRPLPDDPGTAQGGTHVES